MDAIGTERFAQIRDALDQDRVDALDRDAFLLHGAVGALLREVVAPDAEPEAVNAYGALLFMLYALWSHDWPVKTVDAAALRRAIETSAANRATVPDPGPITPVYVQVPPKLAWAEPAPGAPHEPLDGAFLTVRRGTATVLAVLGFRGERDGFTTIEASARLPTAPPGLRGDGTSAWSSRLPGGERAGLLGVVDETELVALALLAVSAADG